MDRAAWRYFYRFFRPCRRFLLLNLLVAACQSLAFLPMMLLVRRIFDTALPAGRLGLLALYCGGVIVLILFNMLLILWTRRGAIRAVKLAIRDLRNDLIQRYCAFSRSYYSRTDLSHLRFTLIQDTERLDMMSIGLLTQALPALLVSLTLSLLLVYLNGLLFAALVGLLSLALGIAWRMKRAIVAANARYRDSQKQYGRGVALLLQIMDLTRTQAAEPFEIERQRSAGDSLRADGQRLDRLRTAYLEMQNTVMTAIGVIILFVGGAAIVGGRMSLGELISFYFLAVLLGNQVKSCWSSLPLIVGGNEALKALGEIVHGADRPPYAGRRRIPFRGDIALESVDFGYDKRPVLKEASLNLKPGGLVVLTGPNGSGKSTIAYLVLGFYRPQSGVLRADGIAYDELDLPALRRRIGFVPQNPIIFPGTIRDNICYGYPETPLADTIRAARSAAAHDFIELLPERYETWVGENGMLLSGGQRQRIAIARALLHRPEVLILDEPATHLDPATVNQLTENLRRLDFSPAILLISHEPGAHPQPARIYGLKDGRLAEVDPAGPRREESA